IDLDHTCHKDLSATLTSPSGTSILLFDFGTWPVCSSDLEGIILDDDATLELTQGSSPFTGLHRPIDDLSTFNGEDAYGEWVLQIEDDTIGDSGTIYEFSLELTVY
ncbi:MAG: proprotein convertase P-domain-containing protein, partial [Myxococcota bacterium]|nr:proprotein convertase P-domain-containing protein [Myxococcota bacterium]